ncbi:RNA polymerase II transcription elongation factor-like protein [Amylocarpus encephaloides]|uniref:RNA polymerase II transcription elongation factor-like protein n=1 Tax=Amylocarpus encephaloides TaxID=45428 RepID=A0A9P7YH77_9HELO|nr:RNA polymerase II transcription elongation factor-like protein [Amylocarpus encephaloides]
MATVSNGGHANGRSNGLPNGTSPGHQIVSKRFSDIPSAIDIPVHTEEDEAVEIDLEELLDDPTELCTLLENESAARTYWMTVSLAYAKQKKVDHAIELLIRGGQVMKGGPKEKLSALTCLCWMYLWKSREAPRVAPEGVMVSEARTKEHYLQLSTSTLNEALRINPSFPPLFLARGVLQLLKASLQPPSKSAAPGAIDLEKAEILRAALKSFDDAIRVSGGRNMMAVLGKSRALFSLGKHADALEGYQEALHKMPDLIDPDPRIGIGCCFWQLGFKEDAKSAWERSLEINPESKIANILLGLFWLDASSRVPSSNRAEFARLYTKAMTEYTQKAYKADKDLPLTCATFAGYFLAKGSMPHVDMLSHKAIQYTDVNAIASDGWYLLARKEHVSDDLEKATDYYRRADEARGGAERGYLPAKFGAAQLAVLKSDFGEAKLRLEKIIQQSKNIEAMILLGTLYAEEVFTSQQSVVKEDKATEFKKAIGYLETARNAWKDGKKNLTPDPTVLLNLARLYEVDQPEKSLQCLQQVEQIQFDQAVKDDRPEDPEELAGLRESFRETLPPQLLNNVGCFHYQSEKFEQAGAMFQVALNACMKTQEKEEVDGDALVTTISYNLGRTYEASGQLDEANTVYEGLLSRHDNYTDARTRQAYIALRQNPTEDGPKKMSELYRDSSADLEVRALYGWYLGRSNSRKRSSSIAEDPELRHYKHTLQNYEKHDRYALIGMGNLYLMTAREMRRDTDQDKQKRSSMYIKAVEFFEKALQLDPKNAYAAQGIAIALVEDKKDYKTALGIFIKVRETVKDPSVFVNLGHIFGELRQFSKAIEHYEIALSKDRSHDATILACLGRTWLAKGKHEKSLAAYKSALEYAEKALGIAPEQVHFKFNVAFVQIQLATAVYNMPEMQRSLSEVQSAATGLEAAIESLDAIAQHPQTPYPKHDIEQRANMARNTMRKQLERSIAAQKEYEERNVERLQAAKLKREEELKKREEAKLAAEQAERDRKQKIAEERLKISEKDKELAELRAEEERAREAAEMTTDSETGERIKRKKKPRAVGGGKRRKKNEEGITDDDDSGAGAPKRRNRQKRGSGDDSEEEKPKKKRKLAKKSQEKPDRYNLSSAIVESDEDGDDGAAEAAKQMENDDVLSDLPNDMDVDDEEEESAPAPVKRKSRRAMIDSDDEDATPAPATRDDSPDTANGDTPMGDSPPLAAPGPEDSEDE